MLIDRQNSLFEFIFKCKFFTGYGEKAIGSDKLQIFINYYNESLQEILYYLATSISISYKQQISAFEVKLKENSIVANDIKLANNKLK